MKLKLVAGISALLISALAYAQQSGPGPTKPTRADAQNVVQIVTSDKVKTQAYCDLTKLEDRLKALQQNTDTKTVETFTKQTRQEKLHAYARGLLQHLRAIRAGEKAEGYPIATIKAAAVWLQTTK